MNEDLLFAYLQEHAPFAEWVAKSPLLADLVVSALITLNNLHGSSLMADLLDCRDAAQVMHMIAREGRFDDVASVFSMQYGQFARQCCPSLARLPNMLVDLLSL